MGKKKLSLIDHGRYVIMCNGFVKLKVLKPKGYITGISYGGIDNILDIKSSESNRGFWDMNWSLPGGADTYHLFSGAEYKVIESNNDRLEVSFTSCYDSSGLGHKLPVNIDIRYILRSGVSGFYCYAVCERLPGWPAFNLSQVRMLFRLRRDIVHYMVISDEKQRVMPTSEDLLPGRGKQLSMPESVLLENPINPDLKGEVDDKFQYSMDNKDDGVHGWISSKPVVGFWLIFPSQEFRNGGPTKQNLTVQTGPDCLAMLQSTHYIGGEAIARFEEGETWNKVYGPIFVYLNSTPTVSNAHKLWIDAKRQRLLEVAKWPYDFVSSPHYLTAWQRGSASGRLFVQDNFAFGSPVPAKHAYIGLSTADTHGAWQTESKDYQFWAQTDSNGYFTIDNVVPGIYKIHGWVPGFIGDYLVRGLINISPGMEVELGDLIYDPVRDGPTVWEIGYPDRTASGFYVPDVNPIYINRLFVNSPEKFRQYGLWDRYTDLHPESEQSFTVGLSDSRKDWFFAHVHRRWAHGKYVPSMWTVKFYLHSVTNGTYRLRLSIASATYSDIKVYVNGTDTDSMVFHVTSLGSDNAIFRHGNHGQYNLISIDISSSLLFKGDNSLFLAQSRGRHAFCGIMYDYLRLEAPGAQKVLDESSSADTFTFDLDTRLTQLS